METALTVDQRLEAITAEIIKSVCPDVPEEFLAAERISAASLATQMSILIREKLRPSISFHEQITQASCTVTIGQGADPLSILISRSSCWGLSDFHKDDVIFMLERCANAPSAQTFVALPVQHHNADFKVLFGTRKLAQFQAHGFRQATFPEILHSLPVLATKEPHLEGRKTIDDWQKRFVRIPGCFAAPRNEPNRPCQAIIHFNTGMLSFMPITDPEHSSEHEHSILVKPLP